MQLAKMDTKEIHLIWEGLDALWCTDPEMQRIRLRLMNACRKELENRGLFITRDLTNRVA